MDDLLWNFFGAANKQFQNNDPTYFSSSPSNMFANGDLQCNYLPIADGFGSSLSKVSLTATQNINSSIGTPTSQLASVTVHGHASVPEKTNSQLQVLQDKLLPETMNAGEALYAIVDGVVYQIVSGNNSHLALPLSTANKEPEESAVGQLALASSNRTMVDGGNGTSIPSARFSFDGSLLFDQAALPTSYQNHSGASDFNSMQVVMVTDSYGLPCSETAQTVVAQSQFATYGRTQPVVAQSQFPIYGQTQPVVAQSQFPTYGQTQVGTSVSSNTSCSSELMRSNVNIVPSAIDSNPGDMLKLLVQASSFNFPVARTILADECSDDEEFCYLETHDNDCIPKSNDAMIPKCIPFTGFFDSYMNFIQGVRSETLSAVANSVVLRRPQLPRYMPDPVWERNESAINRAAASVILYPDERRNVDTDALSVGDSSKHTSVSAEQDFAAQSPGSLTTSSISNPHHEISNGTSSINGERAMLKRHLWKGINEASDSHCSTETNMNLKSAITEKKRLVNLQSNEEARTFATRGSKRGRPKGSRSKTGQGITVYNGSGSLMNINGREKIFGECVMPFNPCDVHHYQKGDFVVDRKDMFKGGSFPIWKIEFGRLLLKFEPHLHPDGRVIHKSACVYTSWSGAIRSNFKAIKVVVTKDTNEQELVLVAPEHVPAPLDSSLDDDMLMEVFVTYVGSVIAKTMDTPASSPSLKGADNYNLSSDDIVDGLIDEAKRVLIAQGCTWKDSFKAMVDELPYYILLEVSSNLPNVRCCQVSLDGAEAATKSIWLYGPSYNRHDLVTVTSEVTRAGAKETLMGCSAFNNFVTYHSLQHYKYHLYKNCLEQVLYFNQTNLSSESEIITSCMQNQIWIQHLFCEFKNLIQKCIVVNVVDTAQLEANLSSNEETASNGSLHALETTFSQSEHGFPFIEHSTSTSSSAQSVSMYLQSEHGMLVNCSSTSEASMQPASCMALPSMISANAHSVLHTMETSQHSIISQTNYDLSFDSLAHAEFSL